MINEKDFNQVYLKIASHYSSSAVGESKHGLCPKCRVKAEIEVRDFIKHSQYFTELKPF